MLSNVLYLIASGCFTLANADDDVAKTQEFKSPAGYPTIFIDSRTQKASGIQTIITRQIQYTAEFEAIGKVLSIQPLLALRERYLVAQAELLGAKSRLKQAKQSLERQQALFSQGITARRSLQEQEALGSEDQSLVDAGTVRLSTIANEARLSWGDELSQWALSGRSDQFKNFLSGKQQLLQVTLPANKNLPDRIDAIFIEPTGDRSKAFKAVFLSRSTQIDSTIPGEVYFFQARASGLPIGMKIKAWIPEATLGQSGVIVPETALIGYMDRLYAYVKVAEESFSRRLIKQFLMTPQGYFLEDLKPGEEVVVTGAQLLLSEELRGQIQDDD